MKKGLKKLGIFALVLGVLLSSTLFYIKNKVKADTIVVNHSYSYIGGYTEQLQGTSNSIDIFYNVRLYCDYDTNYMKVIISFFSDNESVCNYDDIITILYSSVTNNDKVLAVSTQDNDTYYNDWDTNEDDGFEVSQTIEFPCNYKSFRLYIEYYNFDSDNEVEFYRELNLGYGLYYYHSIIDNMKLSAYNEGYSTGSLNTTSNLNASTFFTNLANSFTSILNLKVFGNITIGNIVFIPLSFTIVLVLLKIWRRQ